jgi:hypothetical protein
MAFERLAILVQNTDEDAAAYGDKHAVGLRESKAAMETGFTVAVTTQPVSWIRKTLRGRPRSPGYR